MLFRISQLGGRIVASYWFIPSLLAVAAMLAAGGMLRLDMQLGSSDWSTGDFPLITTAAGARTLLATIAGSAISVAGVVFSITIVVLNMAAAQFGPRLLGNFMQHRGTQFVLGSFMATFVYCLVVLSFVTDVPNNGLSVPQLSVGLGIVLGICSFLLLIYFIHHVSVFIQAAHVIDDVASSLRSVLQRTFPEHETAQQKTPDEETEDDLDARLENEGRAVNALQSGYVQAIDHAQLRWLAQKHQAYFKLLHRAGHFVIAGEALLLAELPGRTTDQREGKQGEDAFDESLQRQLRNSFLLGTARVANQDPEYAVDQLVEIALRALSPGINDPYTAINCIDRIAAMLAELAGRQLPSRYLRDDNGRRCVVTNPFTYSGVVDVAFDQLRQQADGNAAVMFRLLEVIQRLGERDLPKPFRDALAEQLKAIGHLSRDDFRNPRDQEMYRERVAAAKSAIYQEDNPAS